MNVEPKGRFLGELFEGTRTRLLVPTFQRNYSWSVSEVATMWQDLLRFDQTFPGNNVADEEYFFGSIVLVSQGHEQLILDGQQRLATAAILLSVIREFLDRYNHDAAVRTTENWLRGLDDATGQVWDKLTLNKYDRDFFRREVLEPRGPAWVAPTPTLQSHHHIRQVREYLVTKFNDKYASLTPQEAFNWALRVRRLLTDHFFVVAVYTHDRTKAEIAFETLNDRGIGLSNLDLLRNLILSRAPDEAEQAIVDLWGELLALESDIDLSTFLRHYWISRHGDVKAHSLYREVRSSVTAANLNSLDFTRSLVDSANQYRALVACDTEHESLDSRLAHVRELGAYLMYPLLLAALETWADRAQVAALAGAAVVAYTRHAVVGKKEQSTIEDLAFGLARQVREGAALPTVVAALKAFAPGDDAFRLDFSHFATSRTAHARFLLKGLEEDLRTTEELQTAPPSKVHVEHIYPLNPPQDRRWATHTDSVIRLGNLTLLSARLNKQLRNADFATKKAKYAESALLLTKELLALENWDHAQIDGRQQRLAARAVNVWKFT
jgi:hypothetical protein